MESPTDFVQTKARELCEAIVQLPGFADAFQKHQTFMDDELAKYEWQIVNDRGQLLHQKEASGLPLTPGEIGEFDAMRDALLAKPVVADFIDAQQSIQDMQKLVYPMLTKTFELGRVPVPDDFLNDQCDSTCGLH
jgi:cell fate (sporulation/competence/biofilm development) regulator YlbF (YheA/YmcA/DUF963 family)